MFKNKHFIVALLIAPILSIIAYFGTDMAVSEKPHAAKEGQSYKLVSKSNCRYTSGLCDMENGDFKVKFRSEKLTNENLELSLHSAHSLEGVKLLWSTTKSRTRNQSIWSQPIKQGKTGISRYLNLHQQTAG